MKFIRKIWAIVWKDLISEFRTKETILSMSLFSFLVLIIFSFAFGTNTHELRNMMPGIIWVAFIFSGLMGLNRTFGSERDKGTLPGLLLCPISPWGIYLAKMIGVFIFTAIMEALLLVLFAILYNLNLVPVLFPLVLIVFLGTLGFSIIGTILSAISARTRARDVMLSILVFPISVPLVIASVKATGNILAGKSIHTIYPWLKILTAYDLVFLMVAYFTFEFVMEE